LRQSVSALCFHFSSVRELVCVCVCVCVRACVFACACVLCAAALTAFPPSPASAETIVGQPKLKGIPLLVWCNKQDKEVCPDGGFLCSIYIYVYMYIYTYMCVCAYCFAAYVSYVFYNVCASHTYIHSFIHSYACTCNCDKGPRVGLWRCSVSCILQCPVPLHCGCTHFAVWLSLIMPYGFFL